jgi:hypothetical protein
VSKLGGVTAFSAEAALWIAGAALIAGAAGAHWKLPAVDLSAVTGSKPAASASATAVKSAEPSGSPNDFAALTKFLRLESSPDFQFEADFTMSESFVYGEVPMSAQITGKYQTKGQDSSSMLSETTMGSTTQDDTVSVGALTYKSTDGKNWTRSERSASSSSSSSSVVSDGMTFTDEGVAARNGVQLHRLKAGPPDLVNQMFSGTGSGASADTAVTFLFWVKDDGELAAIDMSGTMTVLVDETPVKVTLTASYEVTATSGVEIKAPI